MVVTILAVLAIVSIYLDVTSYIVLTFVVRKSRFGNGISVSFFSSMLAASLATALYGHAKSDVLLYSVALASLAGQILLVFWGISLRKVFRTWEKVFCLALLAGLVGMRFAPNLDLAQGAFSAVNFLAYFSQRKELKDFDRNSVLSPEAVALLFTCGVLMSVYAWTLHYWAPALGYTSFAFGQFLFLRQLPRPKMPTLFKAILTAGFSSR